MQFTKQVTINASADKVWEILGTQFNNISEWSSLVVTSNAIPNLPEGSGRICHVKGFGETVEKLTDFDNQRREFTFTLESAKTPFFLKNIANTWRVEPQGENRSVVTVSPDVNLMPVFSQLMGGMMRKQLEKTSDIILSELKHFAETGQPHPKNQESLATAIV